jgi:hypothetical protein
MRKKKKMRRRKRRRRGGGRGKEEKEDRRRRRRRNYESSRHLCTICGRVKSSTPKCQKYQCKKYGYDSHHMAPKFKLRPTQKKINQASSRLIS